MTPQLSPRRELCGRRAGPPPGRPDALCGRVEDKTVAGGWAGRAGPADIRHTVTLLRITGWIVLFAVVVMIFLICDSGSIMMAYDESFMECIYSLDFFSLLL